MTVELRHGDSREVVAAMPDCSIDAVVTDPPYALVSIVKRFGKAGSAPAKEGVDGLYRRASAGFMGQQWDTGEIVHDVAFWAQIYRVLKPGGHMLAFSGTRTYHRQTCAIEDAEFEIRDMLSWLYGTGFPKSHDVSKEIDKAAGVEREIVSITAPATEAARQWDLGTALKPALEPIVLARKPLVGTVAQNVMQHGTGAINVGACRIGDEEIRTSGSTSSPMAGLMDGLGKTSSGFAGCAKSTHIGRWPANVVHDGSDEVVGTFPFSPRGDSGSVARFFYSAKADKLDRWGSRHPTVKPVALMRWLVRLITPPGGTILDPFAGSGTTGIAALAEGFNCILIEREAQYAADIEERLAFHRGDGRLSVVARNRSKPAGVGALRDGGRSTEAVERRGSLPLFSER